MTGVPRIHIFTHAHAVLVSTSNRWVGCTCYRWVTAVVAVRPFCFKVARAAHQRGLVQYWFVFRNQGLHPENLTKRKPIHALVGSVVHKRPNGIFSSIRRTRVSQLGATKIGTLLQRRVVNVVSTEFRAGSRRKCVKQSKMMAHLMHQRVTRV